MTYEILRVYMGHLHWPSVCSSGYVSFLSWKLSMTLINEAERIAQELVEAIDGFPQATKLEQEAAALLRSQAAEIERLREALDSVAIMSEEASVARYARRAALGIKHDDR